MGIRAFLGRLAKVPSMKTKSEKDKPVGKKVLSPTSEQVRAARQSAGLTQTAAGELIHCSLRTWQQWEAGHREMHPAFWELFLMKTAAMAVKSPT